MNNDTLCPFSKPILGKWCQCQYAKLAERCSGKMNCTRTADLQRTCIELDIEIKNNTRFILGIKDTTIELTHAQLMKIRCGGLIGMSKELGLTSEPVQIRDIVNSSVEKYISLNMFPFNKIVLDIKNFSHRK